MEPLTSRSSRLKWALTLSAATAFGWLLFSRDAPDPQGSFTPDAPPIEARAAPWSAPPGSPVAVPAVGPWGSSPAAALSKRTDLARQMDSAADLRAFWLMAQQRPAEGGLSYAMLATMLCRGRAQAMAAAGLPDRVQLPYTAPEDPSLYAERTARYDRATAVCASFSRSELELATERALFARAAAGGDELRRDADRAARAIASGEAVKRRDALKQVLERGDPLLLAISLESLVTIRPGAEPHYWADGIPVTGVDMALYRAALDVLPCRFGLICDERSPDVLAACLAIGSCATDRIALTRARLQSDERTAFDSMLDHMTRAVGSQDVHWFLPEDVPSSWFTTSSPTRSGEPSDLQRRKASS